MSKIKITDEMVEAGVDGFLDACDLDANTEDLVRGVLRAVAPLIAAAEREACAQVVSDRVPGTEHWASRYLKSAAAAIRARSS